MEERPTGEQQKLSPKEIHFIELVLDGMSRKQAYLEVYKPKTKVDSSIRAMASRVFNTPHVQAYYNEKYSKMYEGKKYPRDRAIHEMLEHLAWMYENRSDKLSETIRKTIMDLDKLSNEGDDLARRESGLRTMFLAIDKSITGVDLTEQISKKYD